MKVVDYSIVSSAPDEDPNDSDHNDEEMEETLVSSDKEEEPIDPEELL